MPVFRVAGGLCPVRRAAMLLVLAAACASLSGVAGCAPPAEPVGFEEVAAAPPDVSKPDAVVRSFLARIGTGRVAGAYDLVCAESREKVSLEQFAGMHAHVLSHAILERFSIDDLVEETPDRIQVHVTYSLMWAEAGSIEHSKVYVAVRDGQAWGVVFPSPQPGDEIPAAGDEPSGDEPSGNEPSGNEPSGDEPSTEPGDAA